MSTETDDRPRCPKCGARPHKRDKAPLGPDGKPDLSRQRWLCSNKLGCRPGRRPLSWTGDPSKPKIRAGTGFDYKKRPPPCRKCGDEATVWNGHAKRATGPRGRYSCTAPGCGFHPTLSIAEHEAALSGDPYPEPLPAWEDKR